MNEDHVTPTNDGPDYWSDWAYWAVRNRKREGGEA